MAGFAQDLGVGLLDLLGGESLYLGKGVQGRLAQRALLQAEYGYVAELVG